MKNLGTITHSKDIVTKEYADNLVVKSAQSTLEVTESGQTSLEIPTEFSEMVSLNVYYNGLLLLNNIHYTIVDNSLDLVGFSTYKGDIVTLIGSNMEVTIL